MKTLVVFSICVLVANAAVVLPEYFEGPGNTEANQLYNSVLTGDIQEAVNQAQDLERRRKSSIIEDVVNKLLIQKKRNIFEFAYKLWIGNGRDIVKQYFPHQIRLIFAERHVKLVNKRDNLALKLSVAVDELNDRSAWGDADDKSTDNVSWKFVPLWENNRVYFKIVSTSRHQYLKLGEKADEAGDHIAYGDNKANTARHHWYLQPSLNHDELLFIIYNREFNQGLKLGRAIDDKGDRRLYGHNGDVSGSPELFGFSISPL